MLTPRQKQILDFVTKYTKKHSYSPSHEEIKKYLKLSSISNIHQHIQALISKGYIKKEKYQKRHLEIPIYNNFVKVPLLGTIAAGEPIEAVEEKETIVVPKNKLPNSGNIYALRVKGDSMVEEKINSGDIVLIKEQNTARNGEKVVALIDNREATLKTFHKEKNQIRLQPANKNMGPIIVKRNQDFAIQGTVVDVIKNEDYTKTPSYTIPPKIEIKKYNPLPLNQIICGDAVKELKKMPDESCDIIIADPPYNIGKDFGNNIDKRGLIEYIDWCKSWIYESIRVMKPTATMFIYGFSEILAHLSVEIPINKRWLIWHYTNKNVASLNFWQRSHEAIICAWKDKPIFNRDNVREPYTEGFLNGAAGKIRKGTLGRFSKNGKETVYNAHAGGALPRDVIKIPALAGGAGMNERWFICKTCKDIFEPRKLRKHSEHEIEKHPTQKPLELSKKIILSATPKDNGIVLVPFVGTGSECVAAKELGQNYLGFEINPDYVKLTEKTLENTKTTAKLL
ncbi:MAG: transcriptional repressor LexA [Parcubacteria group bacterium]|nr:transcriptional repressor LexA [Parcubacteria group bacterium]